MDITNPLVIYLPDTRGVQVSRYGMGNLKIGQHVYTYSRLPGRPKRWAVGSIGHIPITNPDQEEHDEASWTGTCPGSTPECERICYAGRVVQELGDVASMWLRNTLRDDVPPIPINATLLRLHIGGDFDTPAYIMGWISRLQERPDVTCWAYTRSWRVPELLGYLEALRELPNMQLFASMDGSHDDMPPYGWRRAWIDGDPRAGTPQHVAAHMKDPVTHNLITLDGGRSYVCPEETGRQPDCERCRYCFEGKEHDVTFLRHY